ncbi:MAG: hypothetical protein R3D69_18700 [Xanthobacteraceae bacterium]
MRLLGRGFGRHRLQMRVAGVGAALHDGAVEQALGRRHRHDGRNLAAAARLAEDRDVAGVAAEFGDVVAHPGQRRNQIEHAGVRGFREFWQQLPEIQKAEQVQPVIDGDDHHVAATRQPCAVEHAARTRE